MDVVSLLKKYKVDYTEFTVSAESELTKNHPIIFSEISLVFSVKSNSGDFELIKKAVDLSMTKYCGVSAMLSKAIQIKYILQVNGNEIASGYADFENV
jgi:putative redox protein